METALKQPKEGLGSVAETNRLLGGEYFASSGAQIKPFEAIQSSTLTEQPRLNIPTLPVSNTAGAISGLTSAYKDQGVAQTALEQKTLADAEKARETATESKSGLMSTVSEYLGIVDSRAQEEQKAGLSEKAQKVTQYTNQLEGLDRAELNEIKGIEARGDISRGAQQGLIRDVQRRYAFEKADVALLQSAANRDYETARNIVNRKIDLALEPLKLKLDFQKMFYEENQDLLNDKEKRAFDVAIRNSDREYEERKAVEKYKADLTMSALENGRSIPSSTQSKLRNAGTLDEVNQILAEDGVSIAKAGTDVNVPISPQMASDPFIQGLLGTSGGKALTDTTIQKLDKGLTVLGQLGVLQANIESAKTGPIVGAFRSANPWDTQAQIIKNQLNAIVPNLARGIYGEVGVLTDNDIATYSKTIPTLKSTEAVRNAVLYITLDMIGKSVKNTLSVNAAAGRDVSGFVEIYTEMEDAKNSILASIPGAQVPQAFQGQQGAESQDDPLGIKALFDQ